MKYIGTVTFTSVANDDVMVRVKKKEHTIHPTFKLDNPRTKLIISKISFETSGTCTFLINGADELIVSGNYSTSQDFTAQQLVALTPGISITITYEYGDRYIIEPKETTGGGGSAEGGDVDLTAYVKKTDLANQVITKDLKSTTITKSGIPVATVLDLRDFANKTDLQNYPTKTDLGNYPTKIEVSNSFLQKTEALDTYALRTDLDGYVLGSELLSALDNPSGNSLSYSSGKFASSLTVGARGPVGPPNFNNLYVEGSIYMGPQSEVATITGPGASGGNIYLPEGKAFCGLTTEGPITANPDLGIAGDSGIRTIAFIGKVTDEDKSNNESSVYVGTDVSRLYLYSATAYPTIVSKKEVLAFDLNGKLRADEKEVVKTNSPVATQEWVNALLIAMGVVGGQQDNTQYVEAPTNASVAFSSVASDAWSDVSCTWTLGADGFISHSKSTNKTSWSPLLQAGRDWNDMYFKISEANSTNISFVVARTENYVYGIQFGSKNYQLFSIDKAGKRYFNYQTAINTNLDSIGICRMRHDETNDTYVFSSIDSMNNEVKLLDLPMSSFSGFQEYELAEHCHGVVANASEARTNLIQLVSRPSGFSPISGYGQGVNPYAVVRQREKMTLEEAIEQVMSRLSTVEQSSGGSEKPVRSNIKIVATEIKTKEGYAATFDVSLVEKPSSTQVVFVSSDNQYVLVDNPAIIFTPENYNIPQIVRLATYSNSVQGTTTATLTVSSDGVEPKTVSLTLVDKDDASFIPLTIVKFNSPAENFPYTGFSTRTATLSPSNASNKRGTWTTSNPEVIKIEVMQNAIDSTPTMKMTGVGKGKSVVKFVAESGGLEAVCEFTVQ